MPKKLTKKKEMSTDDPSQTPEREAREAQLIQTQNEQTSTALTIPTEEVKIRNSRNPDTERLAVKDKKTGKFVSTTKHRSMSDTMEAQNYLASKDESGLSVKQRLRQHVAETAMTATAQDLNAAVKAAEWLDKEAGYAETRKTLLEGEGSKGGNFVIVMPTHDLMHKEVLDWKDAAQNHENQPKQPKWADVLDVKTNP